MKLTAEEIRVAEEYEVFITSLEVYGIIEIKRPDFLARQFRLLRTGDFGVDLHDVMIGVLQMIRRRDE